MKRRFYTQTELDQVRELYPDMPTAELAKIMGRSISSIYNMANMLDARKSAEYLASPNACRLRRGDHVGAASRFMPGHVPANKGLRRRGWSPGRMRDTQFKKGMRQGIAAKNWCAIGTIRADPEGYLRIKVREGIQGEAYGFGNTKIWPLLSRHVWEQHNGPIPAGHVVVFKDKDRNNCAIENLDLISRRDLMLRNTVQNLPKELALTIQIRGALNRKIRRLSEKQNDRSAQSPVRDPGGIEGPG